MTHEAVPSLNRRNVKIHLWLLLKGGFGILAVNALMLMPLLLINGLIPFVDHVFGHDMNPYSPLMKMYTIVKCKVCVERRTLQSNAFNRVA